MHIGKGYTLAEFVDWTRRRIYLLAVLAAVPVILYQGLGQKWIAIPWVVVALLGTAASFIVGFKNSQTYGRTLEAQQVWTAIAAASRYWGLIARDFPTDRSRTKALVYRHLAWLTALRYQLRRGRVWETAASAPNAEYQERKAFQIPERAAALDDELRKYLADDERERLAGTWDKATRILAEQSTALRAMFGAQELVVLHHTEMQKTLKELIDQQSRAERIKNFPYPRQYAVINRIFVWSFAALLPFGVVAEFDKLNAQVAGSFLAGHMAWLAIPFSVLLAWLYVALDQVGESTENPFEGAANDVPIAQVCRLLEIELRDMLGETGLPRLLQPQGNVIL
jgi:putative membrane protein